MIASGASRGLLDMVGELSPQTLREDIDYLLSTLLSRHPNPFYCTSEQAVRRYCQLFSSRVEELTPANGWSNCWQFLLFSTMATHVSAA